MSERCEAKGQGLYALSGVFTKETIPALERDIAPKFLHDAPVMLDLSGIDDCDSALVALLIEWKRDYPEIQLEAATDRLMRLLHMYQVESYFFDENSK